MKIIIMSLAFALSAAVSVVLAMQAAAELAVRDIPEGTIDCGYCTGMLGFCLQVCCHIFSLRWTRGTEHVAEWSHSRSRGLQADLP